MNEKEFINDLTANIIRYEPNEEGIQYTYYYKDDKATVLYKQIRVDTTFNNYTVVNYFKNNRKIKAVIGNSTHYYNDIITEDFYGNIRSVWRIIDNTNISPDQYYIDSNQVTAEEYWRFARPADE